MNREETLKIRSAKVDVNSEVLETVAGKDLLASIMPGDIEASSLRADAAYLKCHEGMAGTHPLLLMLHTAFSGHKPICLTPDVIWLLVCQGVAAHIRLNAHSLREAITGTDEKQTIQIHRNDFRKGRDNPWEEVFPAFTQQINQAIGKDLHAHMVVAFSTTTIKEKTAFEIAFMDAMAGYFDYEFVTMCGIPEIYLKGTREDYRKMLVALDALREYGLDGWIGKIYPTIEKIIETLNGNADAAFWASIYKENNESGGPFVTGWISDFFPYLTTSLTEQNGVIDFRYQSIAEKQILQTVKVTDLHYDGYKIMKVLMKNPRLEGNARFRTTLDAFPNGLSVVPFTWNYLRQKLRMNFSSGFVGITEDQINNTLQTHINWMVSETAED